MRHQHITRHFHGKFFYKASLFTATHSRVWIRFPACVHYYDDICTSIMFFGTSLAIRPVNSGSPCRSFFDQAIQEAQQYRRQHTQPGGWLACPISISLETFSSSWKPFQVAFQAPSGCLIPQLFLSALPVDDVDFGH